jgi:hypothetical protein
MLHKEITVKFCLVSKQGFVRKFFVREVAEMFQRISGGTLVIES